MNRAQGSNPTSTEGLDKLIKQIFSLASSNENLRNHKAITMEEWFANQDANAIVVKKELLAWASSVAKTELEKVRERWYNTPIEKDGSHMYDAVIPLEVVDKAITALNIGTQISSKETGGK